VISIVVNVLGIAIFAFFRAHPGLLDAGSQNDQIIPLFATQGLPAGLAGVVIAAIFASAMATVASNMNSVSTLFVEDFYRRWRPTAPDATRLRTLKLSAYLVGAIGTVMALLLAALPIKSMMVVWSQFSSLLGGGIVGVYTLGMVTTRANGVGAVCGAIASVFITLAVKLGTTAHWSVYLPCAIFSCMIVGYAVSVLFPGKKKDLTGLTVFTPRKDYVAPAEADTPAAARR
jgi:Na+/proline symporter